MHILLLTSTKVGRGLNRALILASPTSVFQMLHEIQAQNMVYNNKKKSIRGILKTHARLHQSECYLVPNQPAELTQWKEHW